MTGFRHVLDEANTFSARTMFDRRNRAENAPDVYIRVVTGFRHVLDETNAFSVRTMRSWNRDASGAWLQLW